MTHGTEPRDVVLKVAGLSVSFAAGAARTEVVSDVSFELRRGTTLGIVGESGCGKSVTALAIMRLLPRPAGRIERGSIRLLDEELLTLPPAAMRKIRGRRVAMIFQEPMTALNPVKKIGMQLGEVFELHFPELSKAEILEHCLGLMKKVGIPDAAQRLKDYPHQLSGGMRQRVMIAIALACEPEVLIADEPTTALDVTIQAQILELMKDLQREHGMAIVFITHDLGVIAEMCDEVLVMYGGVAVEAAAVGALFQSPRHPYTRGLLSAIPRLDYPRKQRLLTIEGVVPAPGSMPPGCRFYNRCVHAAPKCTGVEPLLRDVEATRSVRCVRAEELTP